MNRTFSFKQGRSSAIMAGVCSIVFAASLSAQVTSVKLPKADSSVSFQVLDSGNVVKLRVNGDGGFYAGGTSGTGTIPVSGEGTRIMWYPAKAAFRAGAVIVGGTQWDAANVGYNSMAVGYCTKASWDESTAMGYFTSASSTASTAMGNQTSASGNSSLAAGFRAAAIGNTSIAMGYMDSAQGDYSTAMGYGSKAKGLYSTAMGSSTASGDYSTAMGGFTTASGTYSTASGFGATAGGVCSIAMGANATASGNYSTAFGTSTYATGYCSVAMGNYVSTNDTGSFVFGDRSVTNVQTATGANKMTMRFSGGYNLFTNAAVSVGVSLAGGGNSWTTISDSTKKTNFVKADHDYFLSSLSKLRLGSWNYKSQDSKNYRHYGPMAQEIFHFFGHDGKGTIGCDTLLASADMDGIMMICLQALEKRTGELQKANEKIAALQSSYDGIKAEMQQMKNDILLLAQTKSGTTSNVAFNTKKGQ